MVKSRYAKGEFFLDKKKSVMIVDDDPLFVTVLEEFLQDDYELYTAKSGHTAINKAMNDRPDLILMDVNMPGLSGHEVVSALKYMPETKKIPIIFITHSNDPNDEEQGLRLGAVDYINKNLRIDEVKARIDKQVQAIKR
jgi:putative two-component system response regulator